MANAKRRKLLRQHPKAQKAKPTLHNKPATPKKQAPKKKHQQQHREEVVIPFDPKDRILLIGEGDLSFAASLIEHHGCVNVTATVLEKDHEELVGKYPSVDENISVVLEGKRKAVKSEEKDEDKDDEKNEGDVDEDEDRDIEEEEQDESQDEDDINDNTQDQDTDQEPDENPPPQPKSNNKLLYNIDATKLPPHLNRPRHNTIIFNFPHVGGKSTDVNRQVRYNQELLVSFFRSALRTLSPGGSIVVTLFEGEPYTLWNIRDLGRHSDLQVERSFRFQSGAYPGYKHARTIGVIRNKKGEIGGGWKGEERSARSYVFRRKGEVGEVKRKRRRDDDSSDEDD